MVKVKEFINRIKFFLTVNPKRTKFIGIIAILVLLPLIIISALTVQNLKQKASESDVVRITDASGNPITQTSDPNVFIDINLSASTQWTLPKSSANNNLIKQAYAVGQSCTSNNGKDSCPKDETCSNISCDEEEYCAGTCEATKNQDQPASAPDNYSQLPASTPTLAPAIIVNTPTPTKKQNSCSDLGNLYQCARSCDSLGNGWKEQASWTNVSCPAINGTNQQCCYYQPTSWILKTVFIENKDTDGSTGGDRPKEIKVTGGKDIAHIPWKLNDLLPGQTNAQRTMQVFLGGDGQTIAFTVTVNLINPDNKTPAVSPAPPVQSDTQPALAPNDNPINYDLDNDGAVNCKDTKILYDQMGKQGSDLSADFDKDRKITGIDLNAILRNYTQGDTAACD